MAIFLRIRVGFGGDQKLLRGALNGWQLSTIMQMRSRDINSVTLGTFDRDGDGTYVFRLPGVGINEFGRSLDADDIRRLVDEYNATFPAPKDTPLSHAALEVLTGPKKLILAPGITHFEIYIDEAFKISSNAAAAWFREHLGGLSGRQIGDRAARPEIQLRLAVGL